MPAFHRWSLKYLVNEDFFNHWSNQMAYVLGFTFADGNIYKTTLAWDIQKKDLNLLEKINKATNSTYPIGVRKRSYRLRISNQKFIRGAIKRGLMPKKNMRDELPKIPERFIRHFVRGFLDGDGWIVLRNGRNEADLGFSSGNTGFLEVLKNVLYKQLRISGKVRKKTKITPKGVKAVTLQLEYYSNNAYKLAVWLYGNLGKEDIYLERKYQKYLKVKDLYNFLNSGTRKVRVIQRRFGKNMKDILTDFNEKGFDGVMIARELGIHSSSSYRWLARFDIKYPVRRRKNE